MEWLSSFTAWISDIPKESKGGIIGAVIAAVISAVIAIISNRNARKIVRMQLESTERQSEQKRTMELRQSVFMPAVKSASSATLVAAKMLNPEVKDLEITGQLEELTTAINCLHAIATADTLAPVIGLSAKIGLLLASMDEHRIGIRQAHDQLKTAQEIFEREVQNGTALVEMMKANNLGDGAPEKQAKINAQWTIHQKLLDEFAAKRDHWREVFKEKASLGYEAWGKRSMDMAPEQIDALLAMRRELGLPLDEDWYRAKIAELHKAAEDVLNEAKRRMESL